MMKFEDQPITVQEYRDRLQKKTCSIKEFSEMLGISMNKAQQLSRVEGFPVLAIGRNRRVILSKVDEFLEQHIGMCL